MIESDITIRGIKDVCIRSGDPDILEKEAEMAVSMIIKWGLLAYDHNENKLKLMPVKDIVNRAFDIAEQIMKTARRKKLVHKGPSLSDLKAYEEKRKAETEKDLNK